MIDAAGRLRAVFVMLLLCAIGLAVGCSSPQRFVYEKRGMTPARLDTDLVECRRESRLRVHKIVPDLVTECMEKRGYSARPAPTD